MNRGDEVVDERLSQWFQLRETTGRAHALTPLEVDVSPRAAEIESPSASLPADTLLTASSAVALAALALGFEHRVGHALAIHMGSCNSARLHFEAGQEPWSGSNRGWKVNEPDRVTGGVAPFRDDLALPVRKLVLGEEESGAPAHLARSLAGGCRALVSRQAPALSEEIELLAFRMLLELLKNIEEHAYRSRPHLGLFGASLLRTRPLLKENLLAPEIARWLRRLEEPGALLEVSICDVGTGVPASLYRAYQAAHTSRQATAERPGLSPSESPDTTTGALRSAICRWALHHRSTSKKRPREFSAGQLSWRGLHHVLHACWRLHGRLELRSAGGLVTVSMDPQDVVVEEHSHGRVIPFPGTQLVLLIPLDHHRSPWRKAVPPRKELSYLKLSGLLKARDTQTWSKISESFEQGPRCVGVIHEFESDEGAFIEAWTALWRDLPPTVIPVHLCLGVPKECFGYLAPIDVEDPAHTEGPPRLVGRAGKDGVIDWWFLGEIPRSCLDQASALLRNGSCPVPERTAAFDFLQHLAVAYPGWIRLAVDGFIFEAAGARVSPEVLRSATASAFEALRKRADSSEWVTDRPDTLVRLSTGRLVRRYISVYRLLEHSPSLADHLSVLLRQTIESLEVEGGRASLIAESPAAYWILQRLLGYRDPDLGARIQRLGQRSSGKPILVADAMNRGDSIRIRLHEVEGCAAVIVLIALGDTLATELDGVPVRWLLQMPFEPGSVTPGGERPEKAKVLESDYVTHIPLPPASDASLRVGTSDEREEFWNTNPQCILPGFRRTGRGLLPVSTSVDWLASDAKDALIRWIVREVSTTLPRRHRKAAHDVVIFTREEAKVRELLAGVASELRGSRAHFEGDVFSHSIPVVHFGDRELFARAGAGLAPTPEPLGFLVESGARPGRGFHAVFLDDRCITGRTLRDFLLRVHHTGTREGVATLTFIPIESRFSPSEEELLTRLLSSLPLGASDSERKASIPFRFCPLFRVPVRSIQNVTDLALLGRVSQLLESAAAADDEAKRYVLGLRDRIDAAHSLARPSLCMPFAPPDSDQEAQGGIHAARIRVLLSHQGQNRGALSSLLKAVELACSDRVPELLSVFTREPDLLDLPPIRHECWPRLTKLAVEILAQTRSSLDAAEAVAFLWLQGSEVARYLPEIVRAMEVHGSTRGLVLAVIADSRRHGLLDDKALGRLERLDTLGAESVRRLRFVVASIDASKEESSLDEETAKRSFRSSLAEIAYHGAAITAIQKLNEWTKMDPASREALSSGNMKESIDVAVVAVERTLLPCLRALHFLLKRRSNPRGARTVQDDLKEVSSSIPRLRDAAFQLETAPRVGSLANRLRDDWVRIQGHLCRTAAERFLILSPEELLRALDVREREFLPPIERWAEDVGCCPTALLAGRFAGWQRSSNLAGGELVFVFCSRPVVDRVIELIETDAIKHGTRAPGQVAVTHDIGRSKLQIQLLNRPKLDDSHGTGRSQLEARRLAGENGFRMDFESLPNGLYSSLLTFDDAVDVTQLKGLS